MATKRLIDANALKAYINKEHPYSGLPMAALICTLELLEYAPTVDAVEVVRCKDCIHFLPNKYTESGGYCNQFGYYDYAPRISENDFCSYGERKDNDGLL